MKYLWCLLLLGACAGEPTVEILEKLPNTGFDQPKIKLLEEGDGFCTAILSLGLKNTGGYSVGEITFSNKTILVQSKKPQGMAIMMMSTPGAKVKISPCPKNIETFEVVLN